MISLPNLPRAPSSGCIGRTVQPGDGPPMWNRCAPHKQATPVVKRSGKLRCKDGDAEAADIRYGSKEPQ